MSVTDPIKLVTIGGGTGLSTLLEGLKQYLSSGTGKPEISLTAIVTVPDDGKSSGRLRREFAVLPPGDMRNGLVALADQNNPLTKLFGHRFSGDGSVGGHSLGNLLIMALSQMKGDFLAAIEQASELLGINARVLPSTLDNVDLVARLNGKTVKGQVAIKSQTTPIRELSLDPADARIALACLDLDACSEDDTPATAATLARRAHTAHGTPAAIVVHPELLLATRMSLMREGIAQVRTAALVNLPEGEDAARAESEARRALAVGADEIELCFPHRAFLLGRDAQARELHKNASLHDLGQWAKAVSDRLHPEDYRTYVIDRLNELLAHEDRSQQPGGILFIEVEGAHAVREQKGLAAYEPVMRQVSATIASFARPDELAAYLRLGLGAR